LCGAGLPDDPAFRTLPLSVRRTGTGRIDTAADFSRRSACRLSKAGSDPETSRSSPHNAFWRTFGFPPQRRSKKMATNPLPTGYHSITPSVVVDNAAKALEFYRDALGAKENYRLPMGDKIGHAEIQIGDSRLMLSDEMPEWDALGPKSRGGATSSFMIYVEDADAAVERAVKAGAKVVQPVENQFWGDRMGTVVDPFGHKWMLGTHVEDVSEDEMKRRGEEWVKSQKKQ
jgi:PhnB protein